VWTVLFKSLALNISGVYIAKNIPFPPENGVNISRCDLELKMLNGGRKTRGK
jgi:hypothetical protein